MKKNDILKETLRFMKMNKSKNITYVITLFFLFLLGSIAVNFSYNYDNYIENQINKDINGRTLLVNKFNSDKGEPYTHEEVNQELKKYNHIEYFYNTDSIIRSFFSDDGKKMLISLLPLKENMKIGIVEGSYIRNDNELICSLSMLPFNDNNIDNIIDMREYLEKEIELYYEQIRVIDMQNIKLERSFNKKFKVVGIYESIFDSVNFGTCYILENELQKMVKESEPIYPEDFYVTPNSSFFNVIIDKVENVNGVLNKLKSEGFDANAVIEFDYSAISMYKYISYILLFLILICTFIVINIYIKNIIKDKKCDIGLYKTFGYKNKTITRLLEVFIFTITGIAYLISIIILLILIHVSNDILSNYISLSIITLKISPLLELAYIVLIFCITYISTRTISKNVYKIEVRNILNDSDI